MGDKLSAPSLPFDDKILFCLHPFFLRVFCPYSFSFQDFLFSGAGGVGGLSFSPEAPAGQEMESPSSCNKGLINLIIFTYIISTYVISTYIHNINLYPLISSFNKGFDQPHYYYNIHWPLLPNS